MASIVIWILQSFDFRLMMVSDSADSMLAAIGRLLAPLFKPLGFGDWISATALVAGLTAKEAVVSTLAVLISGGDVAALPAMLSSMYTPLMGFAFVSFTLLYMPCVAAMAAIRREVGGPRAMLYMAAQTGVAWLVACLIYQIGSLFV